MTEGAGCERTATYQRVHELPAAPLNRVRSVSDAATTAESLAADGLSWLLAEGRDVETGLEWCPARGEDVDPSLYQGGGGIALALLEAHRHFEDDAFADAALGAGRSIAASLSTVDHASLYFGLTGIAFVLGAIGRSLDDAAARIAASQALELVRALFDGVRWNEDFELLAGNAGIALGALACGDEDLALLAVEPYASTAEVTDNGVRGRIVWGRRLDSTTSRTARSGSSPPWLPSAPRRGTRSSSSSRCGVRRTSSAATRPDPLGSSCRTRTRSTPRPGRRGTASDGVTDRLETPRSSGDSSRSLATVPGRTSLTDAGRP